MKIKPFRFTLESVYHLRQEAVAGASQDAYGPVAVVGHHRVIKAVLISSCDRHYLWYMPSDACAHQLMGRYDSM